MTTDPMLGSGVPFSVNRFEGDGSTTIWEFNFAGGYIRRDHVKAYTKSPGGDFEVRTLSWTGPNTVEISPAVADGYQLTIWRDTPKDGPVSDFIDGAVINEINLDNLSKQAVFAAAEMVDLFTETANNADEALELAEQAIEFVNEVTGDVDVTTFARTNLSNTWSAAQNLPPGSQVNGLTIATQNYVTGVLASYATSASVTAAIATAATDATTKANAAQAAAIAAAAADATSKVASQTNPAVNDMVLTGSVKYVAAPVAALAIDVGAAEFHTKSISGNSTFTFSNVPNGSTDGEGFILQLTISSSAVPTFPAAVKWVGTVPSWANGTWLLGFVTFDGGANWLGSANKAN